MVILHKFIVCCLKFFSIFSSGSHFVLGSSTNFMILVVGHPRNMSVKSFRNGAIDLGGDVILKFFYF